MKTEVWPTVTFDSCLGERFANVDFDYQAFADMCDAADVPSAAIENYTVHFSIQHLAAYEGRYLPLRKKAVINTCAASDHDIVEGSLNTTLLHETGHHAYETTRKGRITYAANRAILTAAFAEPAFGLVESIRTFNPLPALLGAAAFIGFIGAYGKNHPTPGTLPQERPAYQFESDYADSLAIVTATLRQERLEALAKRYQPRNWEHLT